MYSELVIKIDIIKTIGFIISAAGLGFVAVRYMTDKFSRIDERLKYLEKTLDETRENVIKSK